MPELLDYFQSLSTQEGTSINESFICCVQCFTHGINKIFCKNNVQELKHHLLEFHAIVFNDNPTRPKEVFERKSIHTSSIRKYFEANENGEQICIKCKMENICTKYSPHTSWSNMKWHLKTKHGFTNSEENDPNPQKKLKPAISEVWKYFCKPTRKGIIIDNDNVYCGKCLESDKKTRYTSNTSTTSLKRHLLVAHNINISDQNSFTNDDDGEEEDVSENKHRKRAKQTKDVISTIPEEILEAAQNICETKGLKIKEYFIAIPNESEKSIFCTFCVINSHKKGYSTNTSTTNLLNHLKLKHDFDPLNTENDQQTKMLLYTENSTSSLFNDEEKKTVNTDVISSIPEEIFEAAQKICETKGLKIQEYFIAIPNESEKSIFCTFCVINCHKKGYSTNTSTTNLVNHLKLKHDFDPRNTQNDQETESNEIKQSGSPIPAHEVLFCTENLTSTNNTNYCRSCGNYDMAFFSKFSSPFIIFDDNDDCKHLTLGDVYSDTTGIQIFPDDGMSQVICFPCEANLKIAYHFKRQSMKTEDKMIQKFSIDQPIDVPIKSELLEEYFDDYSK